MLRGLLAKRLNMASQSTKNDIRREELKAAAELHRFEASMMLGQTAVYLLTTGSLLNAFVEKGISKFNQFGIAVFGIILSLIFYLIIHRCGLNSKGAMKRAGELGKDLCFNLYKPEYRAPKNKFLVGRKVSKWICVIGIFIWLAILIKSLYS